MSQADIDVFVWSACHGTLVVRKGIRVNGQHSSSGCTALQYAVRFERRKMVVALLAAGADVNVKNIHGRTSVWEGAFESIPDILQLLIDGGGSVNEPSIYGETPLISAVSNTYGNATALLQVLLTCPELELDAAYEGKTAEKWAVVARRTQLASAIAQERRRRMRWSALRFTWVAAIVT
jgi:hypothetical protein